VTLLLAMSSCNDALDLDKTLKFTALSVEEQKMKIEDSATGMTNTMDEMNSTKAGKALAGLESIGLPGPAAAPLLRLKADLENKNPQFAANFDKSLRAAIEESDDDEPIWGEYEWNKTNKRWDKKDLVNKFIIKCPGSKFATENTCEITIIYTESSVNIIDSINPDPNSFSKLPSKITAEMKVDGSIVMEAEFEAQYDTDGVPTMLKQTMEIETFKWMAEVKRTEKEFSEKVSFTKGSKTLLKSEAVVNGKLTLSEIEDSEGPEDVINSFAIYFQMMDVAVKGGTKDLKALVDAVDAVNENDSTNKYATRKAYYEALAKAYNDNIVVVAFFADEKKKFADVEYYAAEYTYQEWNQELQIYENVVGGYTLDQRVILSDGSKVRLSDFSDEVLGDVLHSFHGMAY
jgi:hypothetical protein